MKKNWWKSGGILLLLLVFFFGTLAHCGVGVYNDSVQYIAMHIHREPLYPLFLAFFRLFAEGDTALFLAAFVQNLLAVCVIFFLADYLSKAFDFTYWIELLLACIGIVPFFMTRFISSAKIMLESSIMSEAICLPLFAFFILFMLRFLLENHKIRDGIISLLFAFLLSLTRSQMMVTILVWLIAVGYLLIRSRRFRMLICPIVLVIVTFALRSLCICSYNAVFSGAFTGTTFGPVLMLTNVMYACDAEDGEVFAEGSQERAFFDEFYAAADELGANYKYGGDTWQEQAQHLEDVHDVLKYDVMEAQFSETFFRDGHMDYVEENLLVDDIASGMFKKLLPQCFGQWLYDYVLLCLYGFIRSIAMTGGILNWAALIIYAAAIVLTVVRLVKNHSSAGAHAMMLVLLYTAGSVCATSISIMCLSRYMIYSFSPFYMAFVLLIAECLRKKSPRFLRRIIWRKDAKYDTRVTFMQKTK